MAVALGHRILAMATGCDEIGGTKALDFYLLYLHLLYLAKMPYLGGICPDVDTPLQGLVESRGYSIHGCVHSRTIHVLNQTWDHGFARLAITFIGSHASETRLIDHGCHIDGFSSMQ